MDVREVLHELDLTDSETELYMSLLHEGEGTASAIARKAGVQRRLAYDRFQSLLDQGLVSYTDMENKRVYRPTDPERLKDMVEDRKEDIKELEQKVEEVLPELTARFNQDSGGREIKVLEGKEGVKQLFNDELRTGETIYLIGSPEESEEILEYFLPSWTRKRADKDIEIKGVFENSMRGMVGQRAPLEDRYLPEDQESNVSIAIYGDNVGIIFWIEDPLVIMIEDEDAAESFMSYFELVWDAAEE